MAPPPTSLLPCWVNCAPALAATSAARSVPARLAAAVRRCRDPWLTLRVCARGPGLRPANAGAAKEGRSRGAGGQGRRTAARRGQGTTTDGVPPAHGCTPTGGAAFRPTGPQRRRRALLSCRADSRSRCSRRAARPAVTPGPIQPERERDEGVSRRRRDEQRRAVVADVAERGVPPPEHVVEPHVEVEALGAERVRQRGRQRRAQRGVEDGVPRVDEGDVAGGLAELGVAPVVLRVVEVEAADVAAGDGEPGGAELDARGERGEQLGVAAEDVAVVDVDAAVVVVVVVGDEGVVRQRHGAVETERGERVGAGVELEPLVVRVGAVAVDRHAARVERAGVDDLVGEVHEEDVGARPPILVAEGDAGLPVPDVLGAQVGAFGGVLALGVVQRAERGLVLAAGDVGVEVGGVAEAQDGAEAGEEEVVRLREVHPGEHVVVEVVALLRRLEAGGEGERARRLPRRGREQVGAALTELVVVVAVVRRDVGRVVLRPLHRAEAVPAVQAQLAAQRERPGAVGGGQRRHPARVPLVDLAVADEVGGGNDGPARQGDVG